MNQKTFIKAIELNNELNNTLSIIRMIESGSTITVSLSFRTKRSNDDFTYASLIKLLKESRKQLKSYMLKQKKK